MLLAILSGPASSWGFVDFLIVIVIVAACCAVAWLVLTQVFGVQFPPWAVRIFWIVVAAFVAITAIKLIASM